MEHRHRHHRKHIALWSAVGGTMALVVVMWLLLLPVQLKDFRVLGARDVARWRVLRQGQEASSTFREGLERMRKQLQASEQRMMDSEQSVTIPREDILKLQSKIEAAAKKNELHTDETKRE